MILLRIFFWIITCYFLYRFIFGFVIPVLLATRSVRAKMKDMRQNMGEFEQANHTNHTTSSANGTSQPGKSTTSTTSSKGDYIDFEEIK